jgi:dienelactone hydrolase
MASTGLRAASALALLACAAALVWLAREERSGPMHLDLALPSGAPATLYLGAPTDPDGPRFPPAEPGDGAPVVLLVHGYTADRASMSVLARRLARNGYAVLALDVRGHGANRRPFTQDPEGAGLFEDLAAAADWLRGSSWVDGSRLAVMGHSMGAGAALRFAERDAAVDAAVMISGGRTLLGPHRAPNALFLYAGWDPKATRERAAVLAARLAGVAAALDGERYGDFATGTAVRALEVPGNDHSTILWSATAAREILGWLDASFGTVRGGELDLAEPRAAPALLLALALPLALVGIGLAAGSVAPAWPQRGASGRGLPGLALGLALALPAVAVAPLASFLAMDVADVLGAWLFYAGLLLALGVALRGEILVPRIAGRTAGGVGRSLAAGAGAFAGVYALLAPLGVLAHRLVPTPERALAALVLASLLLPFFLASETLLRRGGAAAALGLGLLGKLLVLALLLAGVAAGIVPFVVVLLLGALVVVFVLAEIAAAALYARSGNLLASATLQAAWLAWMIAALMPVCA